MGKATNLHERQFIATCGATSFSVARTCERMGIATKLLVADADAHRLESANWYSDAQKVIAAAQAVEATAVHPGNGVFACSYEFAQMVVSAGLLWVGADPSSLRIAGDSQAIAAAADRAGLRIASRDDLCGITERPKIENPLNYRQVAVDFIGLPNNRAMILGLRDTTAESHGIPAIEETPIVSIPQTQWLPILDQAARFAVETNYLGVGSITMLVADGGPIFLSALIPTLTAGYATTEMASGIDLVECQLRWAFGDQELIAREASPIFVSGHVINAQIRLDHTSAKELPRTHAAIVATRAHDIWVEPCCFRTLLAPDMNRDTLLATIVVHAEHRAAAIRKLETSLTKVNVEGTGTNLPGLRNLLRENAFWNVPVDVALLDSIQLRLRK